MQISHIFIKYHIYIFSSKTAASNSAGMISFQICVWQPRPPFKMADITESEVFFPFSFLAHLAKDNVGFCHHLAFHILILSETG